MPADWFIHTRGRSVSEDYTWFPVGALGTADADAVAERGCGGIPWYSLLDDQKPGLLLCDAPDGGTLLVVTGLVDGARPKDHRQRLIRAVLLGTSRPGDGTGQRELVGVAVAALRDTITANLPVRYGPAQGVDVDARSWERFTRAAADQLTEVRDASPAAEFRCLPDSAQARQRTADSLATVYLRSGARPLSGRLIVLRAPVVSLKIVAPLAPWRAVAGEFTDTPQHGRTDWTRQLEEAARAGAVVGVKAVAAGTRTAGDGGRRLVKWIAGGVLVLAGLLSSLLVGSGPSGWQVTQAVPVPASGGGGVSIAPLGPGEALGAWVSPNSGKVVVAHWDHGAWAVLTPRQPGTAPYGETRAVTVAAGTASDAWVFLSAVPGTGPSYALHWSGGALSAPLPLPAVPGMLRVTAASGDDAAGVDTSQTVAWWPASERTAPVVKLNTRYVRLHWDGTRWRQAPLPPPPAGGSATVISGIAVSGGQVWAAATAPEPGGRTVTALLRLNGATWKREAAPGLAGGASALSPDGSGGLWLAADDGVLHHFKNGAWTTSPAPARDGHSARVLSLAWLPEQKAVVGIGSLSAAPGRVILNFSG